MTNKPPRKYAPLKDTGDDASTKKRVVPKARKSEHSPKARETKQDVHEAITAKIIAAIEAGTGEFQMPWHRPGVAFTIPRNALTEKQYRGSNILSLWIDADDKKFEHQVWATFKQWVRRVSRMKGVTDESMSSVQLCRHVPRAVPVTVPCEAGTKAQGGQPAIGEIRARRRSDG